MSRSYFTEPASHLQFQIESLEILHTLLLSADSLEKKVAFLDRESVVVSAMSNVVFKKWLENSSLEVNYLIKALLAIGQAELLSNVNDSVLLHSEQMQLLVQALSSLERNYSEIGGVVGYHLTTLKLIRNKQIEPELEPLLKGVSYHQPVSIDISQDAQPASVADAVEWGIEGLGKVAEIYPVGGAGDRLDLHDEKTGEALPAAELPFCGRSLLEGLMRDLQAREYLHYKKTGKRILTPVAMMTSQEKNNRTHIEKICEANHWFGRPKKLFRFFDQPLVPMVDSCGHWVSMGPLQPQLKPGGHGVIWKLANDQGVLDWLLQLGCHYALIRQINNPIAGIDYGLLAFTGIGLHQKKSFGFASCPRKINASEGMNVLIEKKRSSGVDYGISNVEYTEFAHHGLHDIPVSPGSHYSAYPANTNVLFVNLEAIKKAVKKMPFPGMIINLKQKQSHGSHEAGRLECTMQNIADAVVDHYERPLDEVKPEHLSTYLTYNQRLKTISVAKKSYVPGKDPAETPEGCFYDLLQNHGELFSNHCKFQLPLLQPVEEYLKQGPSYQIIYHPALGPTYAVIAQKVQKGSLSFGSELQLEIAELELKELDLDGSLIIKADAVMGCIDQSMQLRYGEANGQCVLHRVKVKNKGINRTAKNVYWKNQIEREESLTIILHGNAKFIAKDVSFVGNHRIEVADGSCVTAFLKNGVLNYKEEKLQMLQ